MKAWLLDQLTGVKSLRLADIETPRPAPGEALVKMEFAGLNPADAYLAEAQYPARPTFPHILGRDGIGTIVELATPFDGLTVGQKVLMARSDIGVNRHGTLAEFVTVPADTLVAVPLGWTDQQAAGAYLVYVTAFQALTQWEIPHPSASTQPDYPANRVVLITGASGGVGVASVQLAKAMGDTVIALSRSEEKSTRLRELGADFVLSPADKLWPKKVREFLNPGNPSAKVPGRRVDLAIDSVGGVLLTEVIETLGLWGKVSLVGRLAGTIPGFNTATLFFRRLRIGGVAINTYTPEESQAAWEATLALMDRTHAKPIVDHVFAFSEIQAAFERLAKGPMGKVLVGIQV